MTSALARIEMDLPDLSIPVRSTVGKRIAANTGLMVGAKLLAVLFGIGTLIIAERSLNDPVLFGTVVFIHAYMLFFSEVGAFQSWQAIIRFGTKDVESGDIAGFAKLLKFGIKLDYISAVVSTGVAVAVIWAAIWLGQFLPGVDRSEGLPPGQLQTYTSVYCLLILFRQRGTSTGIFRLFDKFHILALKAVIMPALRFAGAVLAWQMGWGIVGFLCAWFFASLTAYIYLPIMGALELRRRNLLWPVLRAKSPLLKQRPGLWSFAIKSNIDSTLAASSVHLPVLLVTAVFGQAFAGVYKIAEEVAKLLSEGFRLLDQVIYPELARMVSDGRVNQIWRLVRRAATILLLIGLAMAVAVSLVGAAPLNAIFRQDFTLAAPIASQLVTAAALLGIVAPLYPVAYAAGRPERAMLARGTGIAVYVVGFFMLSRLFGQFGPGWAMIIGNVVAAIAAIAMVRRTLREETGKTDEPSPSSSDAPGVEVLGSCSTRIWGLDMVEWQRRTFRKAGATGEGPDRIHILASIALSPNLVRALVARPEVALADGSGRVVAVRSARPWCGGPVPAGLSVLRAGELAGSYNKALRKVEPAYIRDMERDDPGEVMRAQFASSYKGITDFVTKWFWPVPAYYVTRLAARLRITPNQVTTVGFVLCVTAFWGFWTGQWAVGFVTGWLMTFLDTVDGKLARTTMTYSKWGNIYDHGIDLVHPPFWYWAWWHGLGLTLAAQGIELPGWITAALWAILVGYVVDRFVEGVFMRRHGMHIHVWTRFNSALRFFIARRNPNTFVFMLGILATPVEPMAGAWAFVAVAVWTWVCILANLVSSIAAEFAQRPLTSWMDRAASA